MELKETEFHELYDKPIESTSEESEFLSDCHIDTDLELLFPDSYVSNISERVELYRKLDTIASEKSLVEFREMLMDRFGPLPPQSEELLQVVKLRWLARRIGVEKIVLKKSILITYFVNNPESSFYSSEKFKEVIGNIQASPGIFRMREDQEKLSLRSDQVNSVQEAYQVLQKLNNR